MLKFTSWLLIWTISTPTFTLCSPIHRIPNKNYRALINESFLTEILKTVKPYRIGAYHNRNLKDRLTETIDIVDIFRPKPLKTNVRFNTETTTIGVKLNRKSRHKIQSSVKSFKKFTGIYIPIPATRKLFDSLLLTSSPKPETSRDSFMEFYYWVDFGKNKVREFKKVRNRKENDKPYNKDTIINSNQSTTFSDFSAWENEVMKNNKSTALPSYYGFRLGVDSDQKSRYFTIVKSPTYFVNPNISTAPSGLTIAVNNSPINDKIKFFETYDKDSNIISDFSENIEATEMESRITSGGPEFIPVTIKYLNDTSPNGNEETLDFEIDISVYEDENKTKFAGKDILTYESYTQYKKQDKESNTYTKKLTLLPANLTSVNTTKPSKNDFRTHTKNFRERNIKTVTSKYRSNYSKEVSCSKYPFVAAYVYEPLQVFCDAASVSRFWLITAATCLSRKDKGFVKSPQWTQERSAFVSYCSEKWWDPHSITYVKESKTHPQFDKQDKKSRYLYNIGLILVVNAMSSSCIFWSPVPMLSRRLNTQADGHEGVVVGWGLDRYDTKSSSDVPKRHLSLYKGTVYSNACPGNYAYSRVKSAFGVEVLENIYCLSLPPYYGEELDQLHGGLLLENGQLIGLYLEEERRSFGLQSAQYTGVWKHVKWILQNSRDPEDIDNIHLEYLNI